MSYTSEVSETQMYGGATLPATSTDIDTLLDAISAGDHKNVKTILDGWGCDSKKYDPVLQIVASIHQIKAAMSFTPTPPKVPAVDKFSGVSP